jgi:hypothetical protein
MSTLYTFSRQKPERFSRRPAWTADGVSVYTGKAYREPGTWVKAVSIKAPQWKLWTTATDGGKSGLERALRGRLDDAEAVGREVLRRIRLIESGEGWIVPERADSAMTAELMRRDMARHFGGVPVKAVKASLWRRIATMKQCVDTVVSREELRETRA